MQLTSILSPLFRRHALLALALLVFAGLSGPAFADKTIAAPGGASVWTVYAFGNAQAVSDAFRALANFTASKTFQSIVAMIAMLGVLAVGISGGFSAAVGRKFIGYFVSVFVVTYIFFGVGGSGPLVVKVEIYDTVDGTWKAPVTMPAVVGIPASLISTAGHEITRQIEASFTMPDALKMSNGAPFNLAAALINDASKARISDPNLGSSLAYYVQDCFVTGVARGDLNASTLLTSTDFINDIRVNMPSVYVNTLLSPGLIGVPNVVTCVEGWNLINAAINAAGADAASFLRDASAWASTPALSVVNASADAVAQWSSNNGITNGGAMVKQAAVLASFNGAFRQAAAATGNSDFLTGLAVTQAQETQVTGWLVGAEVFNRMMGYVFAILQVFVYAITPLVLAAALVPGLGWALLKNFGQILLWLAIWQPMLAIVNFIVLSMQQADLGGVLHAGGGSYGFTLSTMGVITEKTSNMRAAAVFIGTMVPALAWAMVKGSVDFSRVIGAAGGEKFAASAANTMATGNYSLNQASMDSFTANKHSIGYTGDFGNGMVSTGQGSFMKKHELGGIGGLAAGDQRAGVAQTAQEGTNDARVLSDQVGTQQGAMNTKSGSTSGTHSRVANIGNTGADAENSGTGSSLALTANGGVSVPIGGRNNSGGGGAFTGGPLAMANGGAPADDGANYGRAEGGPLVTGNIGGNVAGQVAANSGRTFNATRQVSDIESGAIANSGTDVDARTVGANAAQNAAESRGVTEARNTQVTGIASMADRVSAMRPYARFESRLAEGRYAKEGTALNEWVTGRNNEGAVNRMANDLAQPNGVANAVNDRKADFEETREGYRGELTERTARAENRSGGYLGDAAGVLPRAQGELGSYQDLAKRGALQTAREALPLIGNERAEQITQPLSDFEANLNSQLPAGPQQVMSAPVAPQVAQGGNTVPSGAAAAAAAAAAARAQNPGGNGAQTPDERDRATPEAQQPAARQPDAQQPAGQPQNSQGSNTAVPAAAAAAMTPRSEQNTTEGERQAAEQNANAANAEAAERARASADAARPQETANSQSGNAAPGQSPLPDGGTGLDRGRENDRAQAEAGAAEAEAKARDEQARREQQGAAPGASLMLMSMSPGTSNMDLPPPPPPPPQAMSALPPMPGQPPGTENGMQPGAMALAQNADPFNNQTDPRNPDQMAMQIAAHEQRIQELTRRQADASDSLYTTDGIVQSAQFRSPEQKEEVRNRIQDAQNRLA